MILLVLAGIALALAGVMVSKARSSSQAASGLEHKDIVT
jgi:hypothetical protein